MSKPAASSGEDEEDDDAAVPAGTKKLGPHQLPELGFRLWRYAKRVEVLEGREPPSASERVIQRVVAQAIRRPAMLVQLLMLMLGCNEGGAPASRTRPFCRAVESCARSRRVRMWLIT